MAGGLASAVLGDFGAEVIKIEPPSGDPFRSHPAWLAWNRGKKSVVLDLKQPAARRQVQQLAARADVVLEAFRPGVARRLGIDYETLSASNRRLVYASISGWGQEGPLSQIAGYEGIVAAKSGRMAAFEGQFDREGPAFAAVPTGTWAASQAAVRGIVAAILARDRDGHGQWVQTSMLQGLIPYDIASLLMRQVARQDKSFAPDTLGASVRLPMLQYLPVRTKDGRWLQHANLMDRLFRSYLKAVGLGWVLEEELFKNAPVMSAESREALREIMLSKMQEKTLAEWMDIYIADGNIAAEPYLYPVDGMRHEQYLHNGHAVEISDPRVGPLTTVGLLAHLNDTPGKVGGPAPYLGEHTNEVLARLEHAAKPSANSNASPKRVEPPRPILDGVTVLDFSTVIAGPYSAAMLAEMGARVIKVDATPEREQTMSTGGMWVIYVKCYAGKECIQVDLRSAEGQKIVHQLVSRADVLLHNFRPGAPERLGIDWGTCAKINPRLIHVYVGAYGATGPHHRRPGAHPLPGALFGALRQAGSAMPPPREKELDLDEIKEVSRLLMRANEANPDPNASQAAATAITLALLARERTGKGQAVEVTMLQANAWANADEAYDYRERPPYNLPDAQCYGLNALYRLYQTAQGWVFLACVSDREWKAFSGAVDRTDWPADPRFATASARKEHDGELATEVGRIFASKSAEQWERMLTAAGVACVATSASGGAFFEDHPHAIANDLAVEVESPRFGKYLRHGAIVNFSDSPARLNACSYSGEHTERIMRELGYTAEQVADLRARHVIHWEKVNRIRGAR
jgi:crotonobetainyl-CoA:carnitine CoA-transferase CaiB-like acyl-CoA transferase